MDESARAQIDTVLRQLDTLIRRGSELRDTLAAHPSNKPALATNRVWHQDCGVMINQLSGGSKAHWLARSFSEAFLIRSRSGGVVETAAPAEIIERMIGVLEQAAASVSQMSARMNEGQPFSGSTAAAPAPRRFDFVHNAQLLPVLEPAFVMGQDELARGHYGLALVTFCGILETIVTDALEHKGISTLAEAGIPEGQIADWPFEHRLAVAEKTGIIRGGCARLPKIARNYREFAEAADTLHTEVSERDARRTMQVLNVVMRDLNPGR